MADSNEIDKAKKDAKNVIDNYENGLKKLNAAAQRNAEIAKEIKRLDASFFCMPVRFVCTMGWSGSLI